MTEKTVREWLGLYFLLITGLAGATILLFGQNLLHLDDVSGAFQILLPVLAGQLTIIFRWYSTARLDSTESVVQIPVFIVKGPPMMVGAILLLAGALKAVGFELDRPDLAPSDESFKHVLTFCVALLNATSIYVITRFFGPAAIPAAGEASIVAHRQPLDTAKEN